MSKEDNKVLARRIVEEMWNTQNLQVIDEVYALEFGGGHAATKQFVSANLAAFPDLEITIQDQIAENDLVVTRYVMRATARNVQYHKPSLSSAAAAVTKDGEDFLFADEWRAGTSAIIISAKLISP